MGFRISDAMGSQRKLNSFSLPKFLPETIITLSFTLPHEDQEVLFYLIACSLKALSMENNQLGKSSRRGRKNSSSHTPSFDCSCFQCYVGFWSRWNGSPNRDVIHEAIEMFEDHMEGIGTASERRRNGKKMKAKEEKLHAKELITWLESNSDMGRENAAAGGEVKLVVKSDQTSDHVGRVEKSRPQVNECFHTAAGLDRSYMRRMVLPLMGFLTENLWTVLWSPLK